MNKKDIVCDCSVIHGDNVEEVRKKMPKEEELYELADFFKVLGDSTRVKIMWALDMEELCVCDLAVLLNMTKSAISHQLRALREARLVKFRKDGKVVYYSLADHHVRQVFEMGYQHIKEERENNNEENI
ncbi:MAG: transcriptional regulator [Fusobacteria bacterium]|nr:MAG: transcriptional regulator [Fusobacteriota bacterium]KAF0229275.1 MAG: transcriptional [Fusobacteriota bacterium]